MKLSLCLLGQIFAHNVRDRRSTTHCSSLTTQSDIAKNIFIPPYSRTNNIGFCRVCESTNKGILMVKNASGEWGSVCDDNWLGGNGENNANAACITLGFIGGSFETINQPNWSLKETSFFLDDVACESSDENFLSCPRKMSAADCTHTENVLLTCDIVESISDRESSTTDLCSSFTSQSNVANSLYIPPSATSTNIGLCRIDETSNQGILMVKKDGEESKWGTVCDDNFDTNDADAACRALGYESGSWETRAQSEWSDNEIPILMDEVACESSYSDFSECEYKSEDDCTHSENVLLNCHSSETITVYAGDIIDGIAIGDDWVFGSPSGAQFTVTLTDEVVTGLTFGYHTDSYWSTGSEFGDHLCKFSIQTDKGSYGPWAAHHGQCGSVTSVALTTTLGEYLTEYSSVSSKDMILVKKAQTITVYAGDIIDGIAIGDELFGASTGDKIPLTLIDEVVTGIRFGYHTDSYWSTGSEFGGHLCQLTIETDKTTYGPWASHHSQCGSVSSVKMTSTVKDYLTKFSSTSTKDKLLVKKAQTIIVYAGDIIDGINVGDEMFGSATGEKISLTLVDEVVTGLTYGYHTHSYWATGSDFGGHLCNFSIQTDKGSYGPWAAHHGECSSESYDTISTSLYDFLKQNGDVSGYQKLLIRQ